MKKIGSYITAGANNSPQANLSNKNTIMTMYGSGENTNASALVKIGRFFYIVDPYTHMYEHISDVPDYIEDAIPFFLAATLIELFICYAKGYQSLRTFYMFTNVSGGMFQQLLKKIIYKPLLWVLYCWINRNYALLSLSYYSLTTWLITFVVLDFLYYWLHRAAHEVNIFWVSHQMHHSSEDMNLTTALRQSVLQETMTCIFYIPMGLFLPPSMFFLHLQLNTLYQFWLHTELVRSIGPLEYVLNTASHHRVHHGRNPYCIDKNYAGVLIIWDRIFNTFAAENDKVAYGLVHKQMTTSPWLLQFGHLIDLLKRVNRMDNMSDKLSVLFRGPSWLSESEKIGLTEDEMKVPEVEQPIIYRDVTEFDVDNCTTEAIYVFIHFGLASLFYAALFEVIQNLSSTEIYGLSFIILSTITTLGFVLEKRSFWYYLELLRCVAILILDGFLTINGYMNPVVPRIAMVFVRVVYVFSICALLYLAVQSRKKMKVK